MRASHSTGELSATPALSEGARTRNLTSAGSLVSLRSVNVRGPAPGTRSYCGAQILSHKTSAPSFSFGTGPSRLTFTGAAARGDQTLQASVSSGGAISPGPIYNPTPQSKWLGDAPTPVFGTEEQRPPSSVSRDISKLTGKSTLPGPGHYPLPSSMGKQALGRSHSSSLYSFGNQPQRVSAAKATPSPGPVYEPKGTIRGSSEKQAFSFGNDVRKARDAGSRTPGPGTYVLKPALGTQPSSQSRSGMIIGFGTPNANSSRSMLPYEGRASPGPIYQNAVACRKQALSTKRSYPNMVFSRANRFAMYGGVANDPGPGPGEYIVRRNAHHAPCPSGRPSPWWASFRCCQLIHLAVLRRCERIVKPRKQASMAVALDVVPAVPLPCPRKRLSREHLC
jgi:hypothetical protein